MKYVSIDCETTGLNPENCKLLAFGAIIEDTTKMLPFEELPKFNAIIVQHEIVGSPRAITMNKDIISLIADYWEASTKEDEEKIKKESGYIFLYEKDLAPEFFRFLFRNGYSYDLTTAASIQRIDDFYYPTINSNTKHININVVGKNFGTFDKLFLEKIPKWKQLIRINQRILDPAILFCDWDKDEILPSLKICKERAGIEGDVSHTALEDAWDVIKLLRTAISINSLPQ